MRYSMSGSCARRLIETSEMEISGYQVEGRDKCEETAASLRVEVKRRGVRRASDIQLYKYTRDKEK